MNDSDWFEYVLTMGKHFVIVCNFKKKQNDARDETQV